MTDRCVRRMIALRLHPDAARVAEEYRSALFACGHPGARSLPPCVPLAFVSESATRERLRSIAAEIAGCALKDGMRRDPFRAGSVGVRSDFPRDGVDAFVGEISPSPAFIPAAGETPFERPFLLFALVRPGVPPELPPFAGVAFRNAYVCNMAFAELEADASGISYEWETGIECWLPKKR